MTATFSHSLSPSQNPHSTPPPPPPPPSLHALAPIFTCTACDGRVYLRGTRRPSFFCAACPSASRVQRRRQRALHAGVNVSVVEGVALLAAAGCGPQSPLPGGGGGGTVCVATTRPHPRPVLDVAATTAAAAAAAHRTASGPVVRPPLPPGPVLPKRAASDWTLGGSGATTTAVGGRCKCGKRISQDHPPCKSGLTLLFERLAARFGGGGGR